MSFQLLRNFPLALTLLALSSGCKLQDDSAQIKLRFRDDAGKSVWDVSASVRTRDGKELVAAGPKMETLTLSMPKESDVGWWGRAAVEAIRDGVNVVVKRGDETITTFDLTLKDLQGGYHWPRFFELPERHSSGCVYCAGYSSYSYDRTIVIPRQQPQVTKAAPLPVELTIQSGMIGVIRTSNNSVIIHIEMFPVKTTGIGTGFSVYTSGGEILHPGGRLDKGQVAFFSLADAVYKVENIDAYDSGAREGIYFLDSNSYAKLRVSEAGDDDVAITYYQSSVWPAVIVTGAEVPGEVERAVSAFRRQANTFPKARAILGREIRVERVKADRARRDVSNEERMGGSIIGGASMMINSSADYWYVVSTSGRQKLFGYLRVDTDELAALCHPPIGDPKQR